MVKRRWAILRDVMSLIPGDLPCRYDTGENFGLDPVEYGREDAISNEYFSRSAYDTAYSKTAFPSCYRGYYSDCTFNAEMDFPVSTVAHVLSLVNGAIGKTFNGYKGGLNMFTDGTLVWGGCTSHSSTGDDRQVMGVEIIDGECIIKTSRDESND